MMRKPLTRWTPQFSVAISLLSAMASLGCSSGVTTHSNPNLTTEDEITKSNEIAEVVALAEEMTDLRQATAETEMQVELEEFAAKCELLIEEKTMGAHWGFCLGDRIRADYLPSDAALTELYRSKLKQTRGLDFIETLGSQIEFVTRVDLSTLDALYEASGEVEKWPVCQPNRALVALKMLNDSRLVPDVVHFPISPQGSGRTAFNNTLERSFSLQFKKFKFSIIPFMSEPMVSIDRVVEKYGTPDQTVKIDGKHRIHTYGFLKLIVGQNDHVICVLLDPAMTTHYGELTQQSTSKPLAITPAESK